MDSYYLDLLTKPEVRIHRHSVPTFIPLEQIAKKHLETDIRRFLSVLADHLNAYVGRRHQADQLQVPVAAAMLVRPSFSLWGTKRYEALERISAVFFPWSTRGSGL